MSSDRFKIKRIEDDDKSEVANFSVDYKEQQRIKDQLEKFDIEPTGDMAVDKATLAKAISEVDKIEHDVEMKVKNQASENSTKLTGTDGDQKTIENFVNGTSSVISSDYMKAYLRMHF